MDDYRKYRQRFTLSLLAWHTIENDADIFISRRIPSKAGMINLILEMYMDESNAAVNKTMTRKSQEIYSELAHIPDGETKTAIIETLLHDYKEALKKQVSSYPGEQSKVSSLTKENFDIAQGWRDEVGCYKGSVAKFFAAVIEEYVRKPYYKREEIILRDLLNELQSCIDNSTYIKITLRNGKQHYVRPFSISHDSDYNYHYLVGLSKRAGIEEKEYIASFRISKIDKVKRLKEPSGRVKEPERKEIEQRIRDSGVQFLLAENSTIVVKLTDLGKKSYESQFHLRPSYTKREKVKDRWIYTFNCTQEQIMYYFFKFGPDVEVLEPLSLRTRFQSKYKSAYNLYVDEQEKEPEVYEQ